MVKTLFLSEEEHRLRSGWRILLQLALMGTFSLTFGLIYGIGLRLTNQSHIQSLLALEIFSALAITLSVFIARKWLDRRSFHTLGLQFDHKTAFELLTGFGIGALCMTLVFGILWSARLLVILSNPLASNSVIQILPALVSGLMVFVLAGWQEELYFRGYLLQNLKDGVNLPVAIMASSLIFGLGHLANPNGTLFGVFGTALAGLLMTYGVLRTHRLWLSIGLHISWNFFEGVIFGFPVSGLEMAHLLEIKVGGSELLTGKAFGPEAGLVILPAILLGVILIRLYPRR